MLGDVRRMPCGRWSREADHHHDAIAFILSPNERLDSMLQGDVRLVLTTAVQPLSQAWRRIGPDPDADDVHNAHHGHHPHQGSDASDIGSSAAFSHTSPWR